MEPVRVPVAARVADNGRTHGGAAMVRLVLGSRNKKKLKEMLDLLGDLGLELTDLTPYPDAPEVEETADTFVGNATLKATQLAPALGAWVIVVPVIGRLSASICSATSPVPDW